MVLVFFATNRNLVGTKGKPDFGEGFNEDGPAAIRFGFAEVPVSAARPDLDAIAITVAAEKINVSDESSRVLGSDIVFTQIRAKMLAHSRDTLAFLHGYANSFRSALHHAARLKAIYKHPFNMFMFSWPSNGRMVPFMDYYLDRTDAKSSSLAMARTLIKYRDFLAEGDRARWCEQRLHLLAHSMGNYALRHAVQGFRSQAASLPRMFDQVILTAADEDHDTFEHDHKLRCLPDMAERVTVYFNNRDLALRVSDGTKANPDRLGSNGPRLRDGLPLKISLVDCQRISPDDRPSDAPKRDWKEHNYHRDSATVVKDITAVLKGGMSDAIPGRAYVPEIRTYRL
ncbi:alpha/beta hydrolase [Inquilinus sp. CAU 1745]|uniref:alpha/beta hydrolase n=1 Tax=Inquilinus sp. CAU 1745 TaxID=3140369 RepID=UPI00325A48DB